MHVHTHVHVYTRPNIMLCRKILTYTLAEHFKRMMNLKIETICRDCRTDISFVIVLKSLTVYFQDQMSNFYSTPESTNSMSHINSKLN